MSGSAMGLPFCDAAAHLLALLLASALKGSLVFAAVYGATRLMREGDPRLKHLLWLGTIGSYLLVLVLSLVGPPLLPADASPELWLGGPVSNLLLPQRSVPPAVPAAASASIIARDTLWAFPLTVLWLIGALIGLARIAVRSFWLRRLVRQAARPGGKGSDRWGPLARRLAAAAGTRRPVRVLESRRFRVPFASGVLHPLVVLPSSARRWSTPRLRAVLLHELRHIRRWDPLTQTGAYAVCALFWFVPLVWLAHSFLYLEQEKACDSGVVSDGVAPGEYAACLLEFARLFQRPTAPAGLYAAGWRKKILAERIHHVVQGAWTGRRGRHVFAVAVLVVCVLVLAGGVRVRQPTWDEGLFQRFVGRWVNEGYPGSYPQPQMTAIRADYLGEEYPFTYSTQASARWTIQVKRLWVDAQGNTYCQFFSRPIEGFPLSTVTLMRVDEGGRVCEMNTKIVASEATARYPQRIEPLLTKYWIYYRE
jgi:beta-lactamase regulating signal transducer with metallopeptidase domain